MSFRVKPVDPAAVIRDPHTLRALHVDGEIVPDNTFWRRRVLDGDVLVLEDTPVIVVTESSTELDAQRAAIQPGARQAIDVPAALEGGERIAPLAAEPSSSTTKPVTAPVAPLTTRKI